MDWLAAYGIETDDHPSRLGVHATLTVILRDLSTDARSYVFLPVEALPPGEGQRRAIVDAVRARFPEARWKTYNGEKQVASFVDSAYLYIVIYEEHERKDGADPVPPQQPLFAA